MKQVDGVGAFYFLMGPFRRIFALILVVVGLDFLLLSTFSCCSCCCCALCVVTIIVVVLLTSILLLLSTFSCYCWSCFALCVVNVIIVLLLILLLLCSFCCWCYYCFCCCSSTRFVWHFREQILHLKCILQDLSCDYYYLQIRIRPASTFICFRSKQNWVWFLS